MDTNPISVRSPEFLGRARWSIAVLLALHGMIHAMGVALLLELGEPGELRYADAHPDPGSALGAFFAAIWGLAGLLFVISAVLLAARRPRWVGTAMAAAVVSLGAVSPVASAAPVGLVVDVVVLVFAIVIWRRSHKRVSV